MRTAVFDELLRADAIVTGAATDAFYCDGLTPQCVLFPETFEEISRCVAAAEEASLAVMPVGNGTSLGVGNPPHQYDAAISTRRLNRILAHEAADMTVTVQAGVTLAELNDALMSARQRLPLDPPHPERLTVGGLIAMDTSGPLRLSQGKVRDLLIGITVLLTDGTLVKGGGRVVKNVAGYDLMKLFTGSFGTLGIIVEATFRVRPCPEHEALFVIPAAETDAAVADALEVLSAPLTPLYVEVLNSAAAAAIGEYQGALIAVGCGGNAEEIEAQHTRLRAWAGERTMRLCGTAERGRLYAALRDLPSSLGSPGGNYAAGFGAKLSLLPSKLAQVLSHTEHEARRRHLRCAILSHVGSGVAYVFMSGSDEASLLSCANSMRAAVRQAKGWTVFEHLGTPLKARIDTWDTDIPGIALMRGIKQALDPHWRLSPGRFAGSI